MNNGCTVESACGEVYLGNADRAVPVSIGNLRHLGSEAEHVTAAVATVTQQQVLIVVSFATHQTGLKEQTQKN